MVYQLPADLKDPERKRKVLSTILQNCDDKIKELQDRRDLIWHELKGLE